MEDSENTPQLPNNNSGKKKPKLPGSSGGKNPLEKKDYDFLNPEATPGGNKGLGDIVEGIKKAIENIKKIIDFLKNLPPQVLLVILIIIIIIGVIGYFLYMPGLIIAKLKEIAQGGLDYVQSWFTTEASSYINKDDIINLANYLEEMEYDLIGYGFITPNPNYSEDHGYLTYADLLENGYVYFEKRGKDENSRYYNEAGEAYDGSYYNSLGILVDNSTGEIVTGEYTDQYGIRRTTEEYSNNAAGKIVNFGSEYASLFVVGNIIDPILGWNVDTKLLRTYLLSDYRIYAIRNNDEGLLSTIFKNIKQTFGGYDSAWSKGLIKFYYSKNGLAYGEWSSSLLDTLSYGDDISIRRTSTGADMSIKNGYFNNPITFTIDGWADRYGMSLEFLLSLHLATMQPDLVYAMLQSFDTEVQVYLNDSGKSKVNAAYVDMLNSEASVDNEEDRITLDDVKNTLANGGFKVAEFTINDNWATEWVNGLAITRTNAQYLLTHLPLESPENCTGQAQEQVMLFGTRFNDVMLDGSTKLLYGYGLSPDNEEASIWDFVVDYASYDYMVPGLGTFKLETNMFNSGIGGNFDRLAIEILPGTNDNVMKDDYSYFLDNDMIDLSNYGYSNVSVSTDKKDLEDKTYVEIIEMKPGIGNEYKTYRVKEVVTTREWTATAKGTDGNDIIDENTGNTEEVKYSLITYKYMIYDDGTDIKNEQTEEWAGNENDGKSIDDLQLIDILVCEFLVRDKTDYELEQAGLFKYNEETGEYITEKTLSETKCSNKYTTQNYQKGAKCCNNCKKYVSRVINALGAVSDQNYTSYTPYIARVLGSWFRDTYFIVPEEIGKNTRYDEYDNLIVEKDYAIYDYIKESSKSSAEMSMIKNSYGNNATFVVVEEEYLAETGEYWTAYKMNGDDYQLYYLYPNGITSDYKMEDFIEDPYTALESYKTGYAERYDITSGMKYDSEEEAEEAGHAFVKKAEIRSLSELSTSSLDDVLWSAYEFNSSGSSTGWTKIKESDGNGPVNDVYDLVGDDYPNTDGGFYYNITSTNKVTQVEDAQRSETNPTVKWLFKYRKYYNYDESEETAMRIIKDKEIVLDWAKDYLKNTLKLSASNVARMLGEYGRSALRQTYNSITLSCDWEDVAEEWLDWQLDMYYSGIINCPESDYKLGSLAFIVTKDEEGNTTSIVETTNLNYKVGDDEELRIGDPRNPDLISATNITKTSLEAFTILENTKTLAAEYAYRDFKELIVELDYFDKEDLSEAIEAVFTWVLPEVSPIGWPIRPFDKQDIEYGALIESHGTYEALGVYLEDGDASAIIKKAISEAKAIADNASIGYTNGSSMKDNMGEVDGDMNCLGFVCNAYSNAGATEPKEYMLNNGVSNFSQVGDALVASGFEDITSQVDLSANSFEKTNLQKGDLVWRWNKDSTGIHGHIAMIYDDEGNIIEATSDIDGKKGDSTGGEIAVTGGWRSEEFTYALRYKGSETSSSSSTSNGSSGSNSSSSSSSSSTNSNSSSTSSVDLSKLQFVGDSWIDGLSSQGVAETSYFYGKVGLSAASPEMSIDAIQVNSDASAIVLYLGVNNTSSANSMNSLIDSLISKYSKPVYVVKVTHVGTNYTTINASTMNSNIDSYNSSVEAHCNSTEGAYFIDATSGLQDDNGYLSSNYATPDGLHLNSKEAYQKWYDNIVSGISGTDEETSTTEVFEGYEGGEYVSSPVTGKVIEYGTHERINVYTDETEEVGYIVIEVINSEDGFTEDNVANNSADTEGLENKDVANGLNLFYEEYKDTCAGYTITIDGFKVDLNTTDEEDKNGSYEQNEVFALYNSAEQEERERNEQAKEDAPFFVNYNGGADLGSLPETYINESNSSEGYYIKEGKYLGVTYTDEESAALTVTTDPVEPTEPTTSEPTTQEPTEPTTSEPTEPEPTSGETEHTGPANYIRIMVKDREYSIIDDVEEYFNIPEPEEDSKNSGYSDPELLDLEILFFTIGEGGPWIKYSDGSFFTTRTDNPNGLTFVANCFQGDNLEIGIIQWTTNRRGLEGIQNFCSAASKYDSQIFGKLAAYANLTNDEYLNENNGYWGALAKDMLEIWNSNPNELMAFEIQFAKEGYLQPCLNAHPWLAERPGVVQGAVMSIQVYKGNTGMLGLTSTMTDQQIISACQDVFDVGRKWQANFANAYLNKEISEEQLREFIYYGTIDGQDGTVKYTY